MSVTVAKYLRLSSEDADLKATGKAESNSISNQRDLLDSFIARTPDFSGAAILEFCDDGWSGKNFERPAFQEMIAQARQGKIQCIVVKDMSRFGRDYLIVGNYISRVFPFLGVRFISVNDGIDSIRPNDVDSLDASFKALIYDLYSRDLSRKVRSAKRFRAERGDFLSPFAPFGYVKDPTNPKRLLIDPAAAEVVRRIFHMMADRTRAADIAKTLNSEAVPTPMLYKRMAECSRTEWPSVQKDNFWTPHTVVKILRDERYVGTNVFGKRTRDMVGNWHSVKVRKEDWITVANTHEEIVTQEEFNRAQASMKVFEERNLAPIRLEGLGGKVYCGICGHRMNRRKGKTARFRCKTHISTEAYFCSQGAVREDDLLDILLKDLHTQAKMTLNLARLGEERQRQNKTSKVTARKALLALQENLSQQERRIKSLYESFAFGKISKSEYLAQRSAALKRRDELVGQIGQMESVMKAANAENDGQSEVVTVFAKYADVPELTAGILNEVLSKVLVYPEGRIEIVWKYQNDLKWILRDTAQDQ